MAWRIAQLLVEGLDNTPRLQGHNWPVAGYQRLSFEGSAKAIPALKKTFE